MDGQIFSVDSDSITPATASIKPTVRRAIAARHARDLNDIRMLKVRVENATTLGDDLIDFGQGNRGIINDWEAALRQFHYSVRERKGIQAEIESARIREAACREELANVPHWTQMAKRSSWNELADAARLRDLADAPQKSSTGRSRNA